MLCHPAGTIIPRRVGLGMDAAKRTRPSPIGAGVSGVRKAVGGDRRYCPVKLRAKVDRTARFYFSQLKPVLATLEGRHNRRHCGEESPRRRRWGGVQAACHCLISGAALDDAMLKAGVLRG